jgi:hypothetical protein
MRGVSMSEAAVLYQDHLPIIYGRVNSFSKTTGVDRSDLLGAANDAFLEAIKRWNPNLGAFAPFLKWKLNHRLARYTKSIPKSVELEDDIAGSKCKEILSFEFMDSINALDSEAKEVINIIFKSGGEIMDGITSPREARGVLREMLEDMGWSRNKVSGTFHAIENLLKGS